MSSTVTSTRARIKLRRIIQETENNVPRAMQDSANLLEKEMRQRVPKDTGNLANLITSKILRKGLRAEVGFRGKKNRRDAFYARFIEFGTKGTSGSRRNSGQTRSRKQKSDGKSFYGQFPDLPGRAATPFMDPTWRNRKPDVISRVSSAINDAVKKAQNL